MFVVANRTSSTGKIVRSIQTPSPQKIDDARPQAVFSFRPSPASRFHHQLILLDLAIRHFTNPHSKRLLAEFGSVAVESHSTALFFCRLHKLLGGPKGARPFAKSWSACPVK